MANSRAPSSPSCNVSRKATGDAAVPLGVPAKGDNARDMRFLFHVCSELDEADTSQHPKGYGLYSQHNLTTTLCVIHVGLVLMRQALDEGQRCHIQEDT